MTYDSAVPTERNEIDFMLQSLQADVTDGKHTWLFVINVAMFMRISTNILIYILAHTHTFIHMFILLTWYLVYTTLP